MKEYGGYLPLEIRHGKEYYYESGLQKVIRLNSGKAAIYCALKSSGAKKVYIPHYICSSVVHIAEKAGVEVERYYIDGEFMPQDVSLCDGEILLAVNYFGIAYEQIVQLSEKYPRLIIDNTQAFFATPILRKGIYNIYSCKKFIGVPDGGYLVGTELKDIPLEQDYSSKKMNFCLESIEYGTGYAYQDKKKNDLRFLEDVNRMSLITRKILEGTDYEYIIDRRKKNFDILDCALQKYNQFSFKGKEFVPYYYPLYLAKGIQTELVEKKVYVPILWKELLSEKYEGKIEKDFSENIVFLPLDQRYSEEDMKEICNRVKWCIEENE